MSGSAISAPESRPRTRLRHDRLATDPYLTEEEIGRRGATPVHLEDLLEQSDIVSLHCPRDKSTLKMIDAGAFARMKPGAVFITTARGGIHDEAALARGA